MTAPSMTSTSLSFIAIEWAALIGDGTGGSGVDSYNAQYAAAGSGSWIELVGQDGAFAVTLSYNFTTASAGSSYDFRVRAHNVHGWGLWSDTTTIQAANVPSKPNQATTAFSDASVRISWVAPSNNFKTITAY